MANHIARLVMAALCSAGLMMPAGCGGGGNTPGGQGQGASGKGAADEGKIEASPLAKRAPATGALFTRLDPAQTGVVVANRGGGDDPQTGGVCIGDVNGDGRPDLFFPRGGGANALYLQRDAMAFENVADSAGLAGEAGDRPAGAVLVDLDNDGDLDIYLCLQNAPNRLYLNPGKAGEPFTEAAGKWALDLADASVPAFADFDADGDLDAYVLPDPGGTHGRLMRNEGDRFADTTEPAGVGGVAGRALSAAWWDYNGDGWIDLYLGCAAPAHDRLLRNNGDGTFTDTADQTLPITSRTTRSVGAGDLDGDGRLDFMTVDASGDAPLPGGGATPTPEAHDPRQVARNAVFINTGTGRFAEAGYLFGLAEPGGSWSAQVADLDHDGLNDVLLANAVFRNRGAMRFDRAGPAWGIDQLDGAQSVAASDLDGDGDLDLVVTDAYGRPHLYRNNSAAGHRVSVELVGTLSNRAGIGALVRLTTDRGLQVRQVMQAGGSPASGGPVLHFGLGDETAVNSLTVYWPSGKVQVFLDLDADRRLVITEPGGKPPGPSSTEALPTPMLAERPLDDVGLDFRHRERAHDDFADQPNLPGKLSQLGGGIAVGDINGDGADDVYLCGAAGQPGALWVWRDGGYVRVDGPWLGHRDREDMAALFLDADSDGDVDLLVTSGSSEFPRGAEAQRDRLYLNDGEGGYIDAPDALPTLGEFSGPIAAADIDGDGDLDLFIGGRAVPGAFPTRPISQLLRNDNGVFTDVTSSFAPELAGVGMVTSACWADTDGDGRPDLVLAQDWGPVRSFINTGSGLVDRTEAAGLGERVGLFNSVTPCDTDGDGDLDLVAMNIGLNTPYGRPTVDQPVHLSYGDRDGDGRPELVAAEPNDDTLLHVAANCLASGVYLNNGDGTYTWQQLPDEVQRSPGYGVVPIDLDADGYLDLAVTQNFFTMHPETGLLRGGLGVVLRGGPHGRLTAWPAADSGLVVFGDGKGLVALDADRDGRPDLLAMQNNDRPVLLADAGFHARSYLAVSLLGNAGNTAAIGARLTATYADGHTQTRVITAGSGYLSQPTSAHYFGNPPGNPVTTITVVWPGGETSAADVPAGESSLVVQPPGTGDAP